MIVTTALGNSVFKRTIKSEWPYASPDERDALMTEIKGIKSKWPYAP